MSLGASLGEKINERRPNDWGWTNYWNSVVFTNEKCACLIAPSRQIRNWFELVVEGEELEDQVSTQEAEEFIISTVFISQKKSKILGRSSPGNVRVDYTITLVTH